MSDRGRPATERQRDYVESMRRGLRLAPALLDNHCVAAYGARLRDLDLSATSRLINEMKSWEAIPGQLLREAGQTDLPGF